MNAKLFSLFAFVALVSAQSESTSASVSVSASASTTVSGAGPAPTLPACVQTCIADQATEAGCDATSPTCICTPDFIAGVTPCVAQCTPEEQQAALSAQTALCAGAGTAVPSASSTAAASTSVPAVTSRSAVPTSTRPLTTAATTPATGTSAAATGAATTNAAVQMAAQGVWAMAAGLFGVAAAL